MTLTLPRADVRLRPCTPEDEQSWLRCRALAFLGSDYYDDVRTEYAATSPGTVSWVAVAPTGPQVTGSIEQPPGDVVGILEIEMPDQGSDNAALATIDTVAVHPDWQGRGIATALLKTVLTELPSHVTEVDAWTRDAPEVRTWYTSRGFTLDQEYLHVYQSWDESTPELCPPPGLSSPVTAFFHAELSDEERWRSTFRRVYRCGRFLRRIR